LHYGPQKRLKQADNSNLYAGYLANFSGNWNNGDNAGPFWLNVNYSTSNANSNLGTQQMLKLSIWPSRRCYFPVPAFGPGREFNK